MPSVTVWRVVAPSRVADPYSGEGARLAGWRFNSAGRPCVYAAASLSTALLEVLAHAGKFSRLQGHFAVPAILDEGDVGTTDVSALPAGWDARPHTSASQAVGDAWLADGRSLALRVPSVVVPVDWNVLLNPAHPAFARINIGDPVPLPLDARLLRSPG